MCDGASGVGKSTELSRLIQHVSPQFRTIRFSATNALDPGSFKPLDVVLLMMAELVEHTAKPVEAEGAGKPPSEARLREIWDWFAAETETRSQARETAATLAAGAGVQPDSLWGQVLGLFATLKGEIKFAATRKTEIVEYRLKRLISLIEVANRLLDECNDLLHQASGHRWLFVGEDFDRAGIATAQIEDLFITYANIFQELRTHLIFNLPIGLYYSSSAARLPFAGDCSFVLPDTPVYLPDHTANTKGREALQQVLNARMKLDLFAPDQMERLIVASGGNLRDLFGLINYAADSAVLQSSDTIQAQDVDGAILNLRSDYERRLGQSPYDQEEVTYDDKAALLVRIYTGDKTAQITNAALYSLLNARAVQEFNGQRWFGVHPLVVDILAIQGRLFASSTGEVPGGSL